MEILTPKMTRRSTRLRVEIPLTLTSLDRRHPLISPCVALVVSPQGCGVRASQALPLETPVLLSELPSGGSASGRVANCLPLGRDGRYFLIGVALYNPANIWGITDPPEDWNEGNAAHTAAPAQVASSKGAWPFNRFSSNGEAHSRRK